MHWIETVLLLLVVLGVLALLVLIRKGLPAYVEEKGKNLATSEDIAEITKKIESVKTEILRANAVEEQKRKLKYEACLEALVVIDSHFSQLFGGPTTVPQPIPTSKFREVHSKLILSCDDETLIEKFAEINFGSRKAVQPQSPTDLLNEFRNMIRKELGFGTELILDRERAWIGTAKSDPATGFGKHFELRGQEMVVKAELPMSAYYGMLKGYNLDPADLVIEKEPDREF